MIRELHFAVQVYSAGRWREGATMPAPRYAACAIVSHQQFMVLAGGWGGPVSRPTLPVLSARRGRWKQLPLPGWTARGAAGCLAGRGGMLVVDGVDLPNSTSPALAKTFIQFQGAGQVRLQTGAGSDWRPEGSLLAWGRGESEESRYQVWRWRAGSGWVITSQLAEPRDQAASCVPGPLFAKMTTNC